MKVIKTKQGLALLLPEDLVKSLGLLEGQELEIKHISGDVFAIFPAKSGERSGKKVRAGKGEERAEELGEEEIELLRKLNKIKFQYRTPKKVKEALTKKEWETLKKLLKKGVILKLVHGKYEKFGGVYSISKDYYDLLKEKEEDEIDNIIKDLGKSGYFYTKDQKIAEELITRLKPELESSQILAIKGFDKVYYFLTSDTLAREWERIKKVLHEGPMSVEGISAKTKLDPGLVKAILEIARESGDVIEKRKGLYALA